MGGRVSCACLERWERCGAVWRLGASRASLGVGQAGVWGGYSDGRVGGGRGHIPISFVESFLWEEPPMKKATFLHPVDCVFTCHLGCVHMDRHATKKAW